MAEQAVQIISELQEVTFSETTKLFRWFLKGQNTLQATYERPPVLVL